jgi:hypothetical protein
MAAIESVEDICNRALSRIGETVQITELETDTSLAGRVCRLWYDHLRLSLLEWREWQFAERISTLTLAGGQTDDRWEYVYNEPTGLIAARGFVVEGRRLLAAHERPEFARKPGYILTDLADAKLIYTFDQITVTRFPPLFAEALISRLAAELSSAMPNKSSLRDKQLAEANLWASNAWVQDQIQQHHQKPNGELEDAREAP